MATLWISPSGNFLLYGSVTWSRNAHIVNLNETHLPGFRLRPQEFESDEIMQVSPDNQIYPELCEKQRSVEWNDRPLDHLQNI